MFRTRSRAHSRSPRTADALFKPLVEADRFGIPAPLVGFDQHDRWRPTPCVHPVRPVRFQGTKSSGIRIPDRQGYAPGQHDLRNRLRPVCVPPDHQHTRPVASRKNRLVPVAQGAIGEPVNKGYAAAPPHPLRPMNVRYTDPLLDHRPQGRMSPGVRKRPYLRPQAVLTENVVVMITPQEDVLPVGGGPHEPGQQAGCRVVFRIKRTRVFLREPGRSLGIHEVPHMNKTVRSEVSYDPYDIINRLL